MKTQMLNDEQILDPAFRKKIIDEINGAENRERKRLFAATWEIWRDQVRKFVLERLADQGFNADTIKIMNQRAANVNLFKKIVSKKARSYSKGIDRSVLKDGATDEKATADIEAVATAMDLTGAMKRADRYRKAARNAMLYIYPELIEDPEDPSRQVWSLCSKVYFPHLYDVIPDAKDHEKMRCLILSPFSEESSAAAQPGLSTGQDGRSLVTYSNPSWQRDQKEQVIANQPRDTGSEKKEYIFWTAKYHLTTDDKGQIIAEKTPESQANPIKRLPCVNIPEEQDGEFWALGGDDLVEATILINLKLTDMESILHMQGWGQLVITGEDLKKDSNYRIGPQVALELSTAKGSTVPTEAQILQHDPHTEEHLKSVEVHVALCLTTNNLSVKSVATNLEASSVASAIAKMVDEAENMDDISEDQEFFSKREKDALRIAEAWLVTLRPVANTMKAIKDTKPLDVLNLSTMFHNQDQVISETERLDNLARRKELGIDTLVDLIKKDNPSLSDKQAEQKALQLKNENEAAGLDPQTPPAKKDAPPRQSDTSNQDPGQKDQNRYPSGG